MKEIEDIVMKYPINQENAYRLQNMVVCKSIDFETAEVIGILCGIGMSFNNAIKVALHSPIKQGCPHEIYFAYLKMVDGFKKTK